VDRFLNNAVNNLEQGDLMVLDNSNLKNVPAQKEAEKKKKGF
jgi:hypothetical protein